MHQTILNILILFLGASIGSFLSVIIYRVHSGEKGILTGRSHCPKCQSKLQWFDLVPIFSWLTLKGKCRNKKCQSKISSIYPLLELTTAGFYLAITLMNLPLLQTILYLTLFTFTIAIFYYDLLYMEIPDRFSLSGIAVALIISLIYNQPTITNALIGATILFLFFLFQFLISKGIWIGGGDLRLGALMGAALGWQKGLVALFLAYLIGSFISLILLYTKKLTKKSQVPFGPFLLAGFYIAFFFGHEIINWYTSLTF